MKACLYILVILLAGCEVQKRHYRHGFHVTGVSKSSRVKSQANPVHLTASAAGTIAKPFSVVPLPPPDSCDILTFSDRTSVKVKIIEINTQEVKYHFCDDASKKVRTARRNSITSITSASDGPTFQPPPPVKDTVQVSDSIPALQGDSIVRTAPGSQDSTSVQPNKNCETIVFRDGTEKQVNLLEITNTEIRYKNCGQELPLYRKYKSEIFMIVHQDGSKEVFKEEPKEPVYEPQEPVYDTKPKIRTSTGLATTAMVFGYISFLIWPMAFLAILFGAIYLSKNKKNPEKYPASKRASSAIRLASISLALWLLLVVLSN